MHAYSSVPERHMPADRPIPDALANIANVLSDAVQRVLPDGTDWRIRLTPVIEATLDRLELVPREEFERQIAQVERLTRDITALEARIRALEPPDVP
jgi:BMFP domain-containing protein YqiC